MEAAEELVLVSAALADTVSNSVRWAPGVTDRMSRDPELNGLQKNQVRDSLRAHAQNNGRIIQIEEAWDQYKHLHRFRYDVMLEYNFILKPVYVEIRYTGLRPDIPMALLVSVHTSFKNKSLP